ncbi:MAG: hypothetical protein EAZ97_15095 [Bacteroidetes bacterium]|nr:MAG: hypothetical protein EAZ97_15095 [Bacteroidota bacterium]
MQSKQNSPEAKLQMKDLQLNSLFETIRSINDNASEENLYKIYRFTLYSNQSIDKLALYVDDQDWYCKSSFGTKNKYQEISLLEKVKQIKEITVLKDKVFEDTPFEEFDLVIPVRHKETILAYAFIGVPAKAKTEGLLDIDFIEALTNIIIVAIENKKLARKEQQQEAFKRQLEIAKDVQSLLFPKKLPYNDNLKIVASYLPHHSVGGDYYDFIEKGTEKFLVCIADVSGKGVPAAIMMSNFQAALRVLVRKNTELKNIVEELNALILQNSGGENFITAFFAEYHYAQKSLTYINAGHNPPFLFTSDTQKHFLEEGTTILGGFETLPFLNICTINKLENFLLFCFTDGFIETYNEKGEEFGVDQLSDFIVKHRNMDQRELHSRLIKHLYHFKGKNMYIDDITLLSCSVRH